VEVHSIDLEHMIRRSPVLEDMHFVNCAHHLELVESNVLKRLTIDGFFDRGRGLTIAAPHLIHFECNGWPLEEISWQKRSSLESAHIDTWCSKRTFDGQYDLTGMVLHAKRLTLCGSDMKVYLTMDKFLYFIVARNILNRNWVFFFVCYYTWYVKLLHNSHIWWLLLSSIKTMNSIMFHKKKESTLIRHSN